MRFSFGVALSLAAAAVLCSAVQASANGSSDESTAAVHSSSDDTRLGTRTADDVEMEEIDTQMFVNPSQAKRQRRPGTPVVFQQSNPFVFSEPPIFRMGSAGSSRSATSNPKRAQRRGALSRSMQPAHDSTTALITERCVSIMIAERGDFEDSVHVVGPEVSLVRRAIVTGDTAELARMLSTGDVVIGDSEISLAVISEGRLSLEALVAMSEHWRYATFFSEGSVLDRAAKTLIGGTIDDALFQDAASYAADQMLVPLLEGSRGPNHETIRVLLDYVQHSRRTLNISWAIMYAYLRDDWKTLEMLAASAVVSGNSWLDVLWDILGHSTDLLENRERFLALASVPIITHLQAMDPAARRFKSRIMLARVLEAGDYAMAHMLASSGIIDVDATLQEIVTDTSGSHIVAIQAMLVFITTDTAALEFLFTRIFDHGVDAARRLNAMLGNAVFVDLYGRVLATVLVRQLHAAVSWTISQTIAVIVEILTQHENNDAFVYAVASALLAPLGDRLYWDTVSDSIASISIYAGLYGSLRTSEDPVAALDALLGNISI